MVKGKTNMGFEFSIDEEILNDWELLEELAGLDTDNGKVVQISKRLLEEDYERLKEHCRDNETGRITVTRMIEELSSIFNSVKALKNL